MSTEESFNHSCHSKNFKSFGLSVPGTLCIYNVIHVYVYTPLYNIVKLSCFFMICSSQIFYVQIYHCHLLKKCCCSPPTLWLSGLSNIQFIMENSDHMSVWWLMVKHCLLQSSGSNKKPILKEQRWRSNMVISSWKLYSTPLIPIQNYN